MFDSRPSISSTAQDNIAPLALLVLAMAVFSAFAISMMGRPLGLDESCSILKAQLPFEGLITYLKSDGHTPLYYLVLKAWLEIFGISELSARMFSLLCQLGAAALLFLHGRLVLRSTWAGVFSSTLFLLGLTTMQTAIFVKMYPLLALLTVLSIITTQQAVGTGKKSYLALTALTVCIASFTNSMAFYFVIGLAAASTIYGRACWLQVMASCLAGIVPYALLWLPIAMGQAHNASIDWIRPSTLLDPFRDIYTLFHHATLVLPIIALVAAGSNGFAPWQRITTLGQTLAQALRNRRTLFPILMFATSFSAFCATSFLVKPLLGVSRYGIIFLPMLSIPAGAILARLENRRLSALMLGGLMILSLIPYSSNKRYPNANLSKQCKEVTQTIVAEMQPGDVIVSIGLSYLPIKLYLDMQSATRHTHMALPRDVETHPGWSRYENRKEDSDDMREQWESVYTVIQRKNPRRVYVLCRKGRIDRWFTDRFSENMSLIKHYRFHAQSWYIEDLYVFSTAKPE